jgi:hypothetical protein
LCIIKLKITESMIKINIVIENFTCKLSVNIACMTCWHNNFNLTELYIEKKIRRIDRLEKNDFTSFDSVNISANIQSAQSSPPQKRNR